MISVSDAKEKILQEVLPLSNTRVRLGESLHRVLAKDVWAPVALPLYDNSAMDGFALRSMETAGANPKNPISLKIVGSHQAGNPLPVRLGPGEALKIMTGAILAPGADAVVPKEDVREAEGRLFLTQPVKFGANIRRRGEEIRKGDLVLSAGTVLTSRGIGLLANLGLNFIFVKKSPRVALIITGNELILPKQKKKHGQIYDSNTPMLRAALQELHLEPCLIQKVRDDEGELTRALKKILPKSDVVLVVGGVSVGDFDFSKSVLEKLGVEKIFWQVAQKPGKPLYFGKKRKTLIFGLPGNPVSVWVCFYEYVRPSLKAMQGWKKTPTRRSKAALGVAIKSTGPSTVFLRGLLQRNNGDATVKPFTHQGSHMLKALAEADCLIPLPPQGKAFEAGEEVEIHPFNGLEGDFL